jgi:hypothetical protein
MPQSVASILAKELGDVRSNAALATVKKRLTEYGFVYIEGLPDGFDHVMYAEQLAPLLPQYDGRFVWSIKADPKFDEHYHSLNTKALNPHTECYEYEGIPPQYLALYCVTPPHCGGGHTQLADGYQFVSSLSSNVRDHCSQHKFKFVSSSGIQASNLGKTARHPMYEIGVEDRPIVRFSYNCMERGGDSVVEKVAEDFVDFFASSHHFVEWKKNAFLIWDNFRVLHSRDAFQDRSRELKRLWLGRLH